MSVTRSPRRNQLLRREEEAAINSARFHGFVAVAIMLALIAVVAAPVIVSMMRGW